MTLARRAKRGVAFAVLAACSAFALLAAAQPKGSAPARAVGAPAVRPLKKGPKPGVAAPPARSAEPSDARDGGAPLAASARDERGASSATKDAGAVLEQKTLDGGARIVRFGEVEVEGRLKSPQIVYFLRRVRAEFAAGDLGHRTFMHELSETRGESSF